MVAYEETMNLKKKLSFIEIFGCSITENLFSAEYRFFPHFYYKICHSMDSAGNPSYANVENDPF